MTGITVIILTKNEARHIARAIASVAPFATRVLVIDSGATDDTVALARAAGAEVLHHPWVNYATQFNWALDQLGPEDGWVLRLDADEVVTPTLAAEISAGLPDVAGLTVLRSMWFQGQPVRFGGVFPTRMLRLIRAGQGRCEDRWMDEHLIANGPVAHLSGQIIDDNRKSLDWWTAKHNAYANREVIDILNHRHGFLPQSRLVARATGRPAAIKRWIKEHLYARLPGGLRAGLYFFYRYVLRLGMLDGRRARAFHVLQGFWYRYLVDAKLAEVTHHMAVSGAGPVAAIHDILGIDLAIAQPAEAQRAA